jgi:hypothetical protein
MSRVLGLRRRFAQQANCRFDKHLAAAGLNAGIRDFVAAASVRAAREETVSGTGEETVSGTVY